MSSKHTPEPWRKVPGKIGLDRNARVITAGHPEPRQVAAVYAGDHDRDANAARIVACVNALAGVTDPMATLAEVRACLETARNMFDGQWEEETCDDEDSIWLPTVRRFDAILAKLGIMS